MITGSHYIRKNYRGALFNKSYLKTVSFASGIIVGSSKPMVDEGLFVTHEFTGDMVVHVGSHVA